MNFKLLLILCVLNSSWAFETKAQNYLYWDTGFTEYEKSWSFGCCSDYFVIVIEDDDLLSDGKDSLGAVNNLFLYGSCELPPESWSEEKVIPVDWTMVRLKGSAEITESGFKADVSNVIHCRNLNDSVQLYVPSTSKLIVKRNKGGRKITMQVITHWCYGSVEEVLNKTYVVRLRKAR